MLGGADNTEGKQAVAGLAVEGCEHREARSEPAAAAHAARVRLLGRNGLAAASYGVLSPAEGKGL